MTFWQAYRAAWRAALAFLAACPLLALVPVALEVLQHVVEVHRGMYTSLVAAKAADADPVRLAFGYAKVIALILPTYWVTRFVAWRDPRAAARLEEPALGLFAVVLLVQAGLSAFGLFALPRTGLSLLLQLVIGGPLGCLLTVWAVAAPLGNNAIGPLRSARIVARRLASTFLLQFLTVLPLMVPHYLLGALAILGPKPLLWPVLTADALLVGWLAALTATGGFYAARRACETQGIPLVPPPATPLRERQALA